MRTHLTLRLSRLVDGTIFYNSTLLLKGCRGAAVLGPSVIAVSPPVTPNKKKRSF